MFEWFLYVGESIEGNTVLIGLTSLVVLAGIVGGVSGLTQRSLRVGGAVLLGYSLGTITAAVYWVLNTHDAELRLINATVYPLRVAVTHPVAGEVWLTKSWLTLHPGQSLRYETRLRFAEPTFEVYAQTVNTDLVHFVYRDAVLEDSDMPIDFLEWVGMSETRNLPPVDATALTRGLRHLPGPLHEGGTQAQFHSVPRLGDRHQFVFQDPDWIPELAQPVDGEADLQDVLHRARTIRGSLDRQMACEREWGNAEVFPYTLGIIPEDRNGHVVRGVRIRGHLGSFANGRPLPFQQGDVLVNLGGGEVYGPFDIVALLNQHATDRRKGIEVPLGFKVYRSGQLISGETSYFFVKQYFNPRDQKMTKGGSVVAGFADGVVLGAGPEVLATTAVVAVGMRNAGEWLRGLFNKKHKPRYRDLPNWSKIEWRATQERAMRRQWHGEAYAAGEFGSFFVNIPRGVAKKVLGRSARPVMNSLVGRVGFELGEAMIWEINSGDSLRTHGELVDSLKHIAPWAAVGGVAQGTLRSTRSSQLKNGRKN